MNDTTLKQAIENVMWELAGKKNASVKELANIRVRLLEIAGLPTGVKK